MRTTVTLDDDAYDAALTLAKSSGKRLGAVISQLIKRAIQPMNSPEASGAKAFPKFTVPHGTPMISLRKVRRAWEEE